MNSYRKTLRKCTLHTLFMTFSNVKRSLKYSWSKSTFTPFYLISIHSRLVLIKQKVPTYFVTRSYEKCLIPLYRIHTEVPSPITTLVINIIFICFHFGMCKKAAELRTLSFLVVGYEGIWFESDIAHTTRLQIL